MLLVYFSPFSQLGPLPFGPIWSIQSIWSNLVHSFHFSPIQFYSVHFFQLRSIHLVQFGPLWSYLVNWSISVHLLKFNLIRSIWSNSVQFSLIWSTSVHSIYLGPFGLIPTIRSNSVLSVHSVHSVYLGLFGPILSTSVLSVHLVNFSPLRNYSVQ